MKPWGAVIRITKNFKQIAKYEDRVALDAYIAGPDFKRLMAIATTEHVDVIMRAYDQAKAKCEERRPVPAPGTRRAQWDERLLSRLEAAWKRHNGNLPRIAHELNITEGAARAAYRDHILGAATRRVPRNNPYSAPRAAFPSGVPGCSASQKSESEPIELAVA